MIKFGNFEIDPRARELRKSGLRIRLQDQPFEILAMMLDRPGEVVTREELRQRLWPAGTFVDFEHSLNAAVKRLRAALGDDADNPRFVETLHRRGYRFIAPIDPHANGSVRARRSLLTPAAVTVEQSRLAVLPFENLSRDASQEYFSDGLTEEMITQIGRLCSDRLGVLARSSSMRFKGSGKTANEIGQELGVDYVLEGRVRREGDRIRISAQLIETRSGLQLWAETYDRRLEETLLLQSDVAARIAHSLAMELVPEQSEAIKRVSPRQSEAYQAYLKGRFHWNRPGDEGLEAALGYYSRALHLDPNFPAALAALARGEIALADYARQPGRQALERARAAAARAVELDPGLSDAYVALGDVHKALDWNWTAAEAAYRTAVALSPSCENAHQSMAVFLSAIGRHDEAKREAERARWLGPICLSINTSAGWVRYAAGEYDEAINQCRHTLEMASEYASARRLLGASYVAAGMYREAIRELEIVAGHDCAPAISIAWLAQAKAAAGKTDEAGWIVRELEQPDDGRYVPGYHLAMAYVALNDFDRAFSLLDRACDERDPALVAIAVEPRFEPLRDDPRYAALLAAMHLGG